MMKKFLIFSVLISILGAFSAYADEFRFNPHLEPATGDREFDELLKNMNRAAGGRMNDYIDDLSHSFNIPRKEAASLIYTENMQPADAFLLLHIARLTGQPYHKLVNEFKRHGRKGWGPLVTSLGIKPGSKRFLLLKEGIPPGLLNHFIIIKEEAKEKKGSKKKGSKKKKSKKKGSKKKGSKKKGSKGKYEE